MRYVAFLRAINTGNRRIKMHDLRQVYVDAGYSDAETYIATGNVIFSADAPPDLDQLESAFEERFGFSSQVFLRNEESIANLMDGVPWGETDGVIDVSFLERAPEEKAARALEATAAEPEALAVIGTEVFSLRPRPGIETAHKESTTVKVLKTQTTRRGIRTVRKIQEKYLASPDSLQTAEGS